LDRGRAYGAKSEHWPATARSSGQRVRAADGRWILADTSSTAAYEPTRAFYRRCGYRMLSEISDFYRVTDGKIIFGKRLDRP